MCESLIAGSALVTGAWLPYSRLRLNNVFYHEIGDLESIGRALQTALSDLEAEKAWTRRSASVIERLVSWKNVQPQWESLYDELLSK
jgi:hypothetical protein